MRELEMASVEECRAALEHLTDRMAANADTTRAKLDFDRTLSCRIPDLGVAFHARLSDGQIVDVNDGDNPKAKLKLTAGSDDLVALVRGKLNVASAWANGRIKIDASLMDMMKLRKLL
jgi:predicted lipid carrier protein YhbT